MSDEGIRPAAGDHVGGGSAIAYPLRLSFKIIALANQATMTDARGASVLYTRQKLLKFKEHVEVFTDTSQAQKLADIHADRVIDWSARYTATDDRGRALGALGRRGWRSLWRAHYEVFAPDGDAPTFSIREENPVAKVFDSILGEIPVLGFFTGYAFHPRYVATRADGTPAMRMTKQPAMFEGVFEIERLADLSPREEVNLLLSFLMMVMLERARG